MERFDSIYYSIFISILFLIIVIPLYRETDLIRMFLLKIEQRIIPVET